ncbi:MAG: tetraacyldisaccharide 4'-kinase [Bacteroidales bacterium]
MDSLAKIVTNIALYPLSKVYGFATTLRNIMFDAEVLKQTKFDIPVVVVGNLSLGGTGKTPHVEYIIESLKNTYNIGVISRGYKRKSKGYILADNSSTVKTIGDEPFQIYRKYGRDVKVAVSESRVKGIQSLRKAFPELNLILLDDAFQHRYVDAAVSILLMDYNNPIYNDHLFPLGRLRETKRGIYRADIVVTTKCPMNLKSFDYRNVKCDLNLSPSQDLFYSRYKYGNLISVFPEYSVYIPSLDLLSDYDAILAVSGIANPKPFNNYLRNFTKRVRTIKFADHKDFTEADISKIISKYKSLKGYRRIIVTTEKDAVRLVNCKSLSNEIKANIFYLPIKVDFVTDSTVSFIDILKYRINEFKRTSAIIKSKYK